MHQIINAVIYLPPAVALDSMWARQCLAHIERRGYHLLSVVSVWADALTMTRGGQAQVIVFARQDHLTEDFCPRIEFVGDETVDLCQFGTVQPRGAKPGEAGDVRSRRPRPAV